VAARKAYKLIQTGSQAPDFQLPLVQGGDRSLKQLLTRSRVLLAFFKITCPVCQLAFPFLERIHASGNLSIYGVSQNDPADTEDFNREFGVTFPTLLDSEDRGFPVSNDYGIGIVPTLFLVEPSGAVALVSEGWTKKDIAWLGTQAGVNVFRQDDDVPEWKAG